MLTIYVDTAQELHVHQSTHWNGHTWCYIATCCTLIQHTMHSAGEVGVYIYMDSWQHSSNFSICCL